MMLKVVVVEDSSLLRKGIIFTTEWEKVNCEVVGEAENGIEGVKVITELEPDIVITDIKMPGMDGISMIENLQGKTNALFIIMSAYSEFEYARRALRMGVMDYLTKPIEDTDLIQTLASACETIRRQKVVDKIEEKLTKMDDSRIMLFKEYLAEDSSSKAVFAQKAVDFIHANFQRDISVKNIADSLLLSESYLSKIFKDKTGYTIGDYIAYYRIKQACRLLSNPSLKIYEITEKIGYKDQRYFSVMFKKIVGVTPKEFKDKLNKD